jgi:beta-lactamase superfamily II metal-dependent hydrolase
MTLEYGDKKIMFTGDAETDNLDEYVENYGSLNNVDVLKVGHHGSNNATTEAFIQAIDPEYAIIQCGVDNGYGHPHQATIDILSGHDGGITIYRNDTNGLITMSMPFSGDLEFDLEKDDCSKNYYNGAQIKSLLIDYQDYINNRKILVA